MVGRPLLGPLLSRRFSNIARSQSHIRPICADSECHPSPRANQASDVLPEQHVPEYLKGQGPCSQSRILAVLAASGPAVRPSDATARSTDIRMMSAEASCWIAEASPDDDWDPPPPVAWPRAARPAR